MGSVTSFIDIINLGMDYLVTVLFLLALAILVAWYTIGRIRSYTKKGESAGKGLFLGVLALVEAILCAALILLLPVYLAGLRLFSGRIGPSVFRWILLYLLVTPLLYFSTRKNSGRRGLYAALVILTIGLFGWWYQHWMGILLISLPIYGLLIFLIYRMAQVILPSSDPEDKKETRPKFTIFLDYLLGIQYPFWVTKGSASREIEARIPGDYFNEFSGPGSIWTRSHQVVGISAGIEFNQVEGPGFLFTNIYDRPVAVVDLRTQLRTSEVEATTKDGMPIKAILFTSFIIDNEDWPKKGSKAEDRKQLELDFKANALLRDGLRVKRIGSFAYSTARIKSVLGTAGVNTNPLADGANPTIYWDEWTLKLIENATRQVIAERTVDELWRPIVNQSGASALDEIAIIIRGIVEPELRRVGINLFASRIVNFSIAPNSPIRNQQIETWKNLWASRITAAQADIEASYKEEIEKAHAYAKSEILDAIADSIQKARAVDPELPRHVIALYYIHAIEEIIQKQPEADSPEAKARKERFETVKQFLLYNNQE